MRAGRRTAWATAAALLLVGTTALVDALKELGDLPRDFSADRLFMPGITQISD